MLYRCFFLGADGHVMFGEVIEADNDPEAVEKGVAMLEARPHHHGMEVWHGARRLYASPAAR